MWLITDHKLKHCYPYTENHIGKPEFDIKVEDPFDDFSMANETNKLVANDVNNKVVQDAAKYGMQWRSCSVVIVDKSLAL